MSALLMGGLFSACSSLPLGPSSSSAETVTAKKLLSGEDPGTKSHYLYLENGRGEFENSHLATDKMLYEPMKLVFARVEEDSQSAQGPYMTYLALMKSAEEIGAHDIINVIVVVTVNVNIQSAGSRCFA